MKTDKLESLYTHIEEKRVLRDFEGIFHYASLLYTASREQNNDHYLIISCYFLGSSYFNTGVYDKAMKYLQEGIRIGEHAPYPFFQMMCYNLAGMVSGTLGDDIMSVEYMLKSYYIALDHQELGYLYIILNNLGVLFFNLGYYEIAKEYFTNAFEERGIGSYNDLKINDGFNIINLMGTSIYLKDDLEYERWLIWYREFQKRFQIVTVENDYQMYQVLLCAHTQDIARLRVEVVRFLEIAGREEDRLHTFKNLLKVFKVCMQFQEQKLSSQILYELQLILQDYPNYQNHSELKECQVIYANTFKAEQERLQALEEYYDIRQLELSAAHNNMKNTLLLKIDMEQLLYERNQILKENRELERRSEIEEFTNVMNKTAFRTHVSAELETMHQDQYVCLLVIDIDKFKSINDTFGHLVGDQVLLHVVKVLKEVLRSSDFIGRIGGDEFCVFMKNILSLPYLYERLDEILDRLVNTRIEDRQVLSASIGVCMSNHICRYDEIFQKADEAMYHAKHAGGNCYDITELST